MWMNATRALLSLPRYLHLVGLDDLIVLSNLNDCMIYKKPFLKRESEKDPWAGWVRQRVFSGDMHFSHAVMLASNIDLILHPLFL